MFILLIVFLATGDVLAYGERGQPEEFASEVICLAKLAEIDKSLKATPNIPPYRLACAAA